MAQACGKRPTLLSFHACIIALLITTSDAFSQAPLLHGCPKFCRCASVKPAVCRCQSVKPVTGHTMPTNSKTMRAMQPQTDVNAGLLEGAEQAVRLSRRKTTKPNSRKASCLLAQPAAKQPTTSVKKTFHDMFGLHTNESEDRMDSRHRGMALAIASPLFGLALLAAKHSADEVVLELKNAIKCPPNAVSILRDLARRSLPIKVALASGRPTLIQFYTEWCRKCKSMASHIEELEQEYGKRKINFVVLDAEQPENAKLVGYFRVDTIPHMAFIDGDKVLQTTLTGHVPREVMVMHLKTFAAKRLLPLCGPGACCRGPGTPSRVPVTAATPP